MVQTAEIVVLGGGPGGLSAATALALHGLKVIVVNDGRLMGHGIEGAFKSKAQFEIARQYAHVTFRHDVFGHLSAPNFGSVARGIERAAEDLTTGIETRLQRLGVKLVKGKGRFTDPNTIQVGADTLQAKHIVIATGSVPRVFPGVPVDRTRILTSAEIVRLTSLPKSLLILGAGVIGCEFACIFNELGSEVKLVDTEDRILASEDEDIGRFLTRGFSRRGIEILASCRYEKLDIDKNGVTTKLSNGQRIRTESVLFAVGRSSSTEGLNLTAAGVQSDGRGNIPTDDNMRTNVPHIYAVGDVGQRRSWTNIALAHVAEAEGRRAAYGILEKSFTQNMNHVPYIIFTIPMIAGAGLGEAAARERYGRVRVGKYPYGRNHRAHAIFPPIGFVKLIVAPEGDDRILGVRAIGRDADALVSTASVLIDQALPYTYLVDSIMPHPSLLECLQGAAHIIAGDALSYEEGEEYQCNYLIGDTPGK